MTKFKVGDICVDNAQRESHTTFEIVGIEYGRYIYVGKDERNTYKPFSLPFDEFEENGTRKLTKLELALA